MNDIVTELPRILIEAHKAGLHATGGVPRPQVHMFAEDMAQPYVGSITCRRFYRGEDAVAAIGHLGALSSVMKMTRLIVLWESADLAVALDQEDGPFPMGLMLVDARFGGHALHRHPFEAVPTGRIENGVPTIRLSWATPTIEENTALPVPIDRLLGTWREFHDGDIQETAIALQEAGYEFDWITARK